MRRLIYPFGKAILALSMVLLLGFLASRASAQPGRHGPRRSVPQEQYKPPASSPEIVALWQDFYVSSNLSQREDSQVVRKAYLEILQRWATASSREDVELLGEMEFRLRAKGRCYPTEADKTLELIGETQLGAVLPAAMLHVYAWEDQLKSRRFTGLEHNAERIRDLMKQHVAGLDSSAEARREAADLLTHLAERIWEAGYIDLYVVADSLLDTVLGMDPDHIAGRYLRAMIAEKLGYYRRALRDFETPEPSAPVAG